MKKVVFPTFFPKSIYVTHTFSLRLSVYHNQKLCQLMPTLQGLTRGDSNRILPVRSKGSRSQTMLVDNTKRYSFYINTSRPIHLMSTMSTGH